MEALLSLSPSTSRPYRPFSLLRRHLNPNVRRRRLHRHPFHITTKIRSQITSSPSQPGSIPATASASENFDWFAHWYPLAPICDLDKRIPHAKTVLVLGLDVVIWWDRETARWQVFDDRCPHRLAPLSEGRIDQRGRLQCVYHGWCFVYHGWCFDGAGNCKYIPQAPPDGPPVHTNAKACATVYPSFEQNKILWFWPRTDPLGINIPTKEKPPYIPELDDPSYTSTMGMRDLPYGYEVLVENLMDPAHVAYAHYGIMKVPKRSQPPGRVETDREGGVPIEITIESLDKSGFLSRNPFGYGHFVAPCLFNSFPRLPHTTTLPGVSKESSVIATQQQKRILLIFLCIPVSPGRSRVIWVFPRNFSVWVDQLIPRWIFHIGQNLILDSDIYLLHLEERKIAEAGPSNWQKACYVPTKSDAMVVAFRKWLRKYAQSQVDWGTKSHHLPPTPPKEQLMDRYWSHVVNCISCRRALQGLKVLQIALQVASIAAIGILAAVRQSLVSVVVRVAIVSAALLCFLASKWLSHFIYKTFYFHDYNHAFRYWSHVVNCISCRRALQGLKVLQIALQVASIAAIGILAAARQSLVSVVVRAAIVSAALLCFLASKWLSHFIYKTFYFHDYNHAFR